MKKVEISPSQVKTFCRCRRKWGYDKVDKVPRAEGKKADFGKKVHKHLEIWMGKRELPKKDPAGKVVRDALKVKNFLPNPSPDFELEKHFNYDVPEVEGTGTRGIIDLLNDNHVMDYKTTGSKIYALSEEDFPKDPQVVLYGMAGMLRAKTDWFKASWLYFILAWKKDGSVRLKGTLKREATLGVNDIRDQWHGLCETFEQIRDARRNVQFAKDLPANYDACGDFGGCPYVGLCPADPGDRLVHLLGGKK